MGVFGSLREGRARRRGPDGRRRARAVLASLVLVSSAVPIFAATSGSSAAAPVTSPTYSNKMLDSGFPTWFEDVNGVRVEACLDPNDANCLAPLTALPGFDAAQPLAFPTNFPDEFFYSAADSEAITVADCAVGTGSVSVHLALEAAFINGAPAQGDQMVFGRIRIVAKAGSGLCGDTWYTFRTPYGDLTIRTEPDGTIRGGVAAANTVDIGCFPSPVRPCNFDETLAAPVLSQGLLRQSAVAVNGPAVPGYLGNGTFDLIEGGVGGVNRFEVLKWPADVTPAAGYGVPCVAECAPVGATDNFQLLAKLAGPLEADKDVVDFGGQLVGSPSAALTSTVVNLGSGVDGTGATTVGAVQLDDPTGQFSIVGDTCSDAALLRDATCSVSVVFTPSTVPVDHVPSKATLTFTDVPADPNVPARPKVVTLLGTGINAGDAPVASVDPETVFFPETRITTLSDAVAVTVSNSSLNGASAPLLVQPQPIADPNFIISHDGCSATYVPVDGSCTVLVRFKPGIPKGLKASVLDIVTNVAPLAVGLNGTAAGGIATESPTLDPVNTFPDWYQDERGVRVGQCDNPANLKCIAAPLPVAGAPQSFPDNYPDEWFYYIMQSDAVAFTDEACLVGGELTTVSGDLSVEVAAEAAFLGPIEPNGGITFGRVRVVARNLCPETTYVIEHPYGVLTLTTNDLGDIKPNMSTVDVGCLAAPCDFHEAISAIVFEGFLTQSNRSPGYLGDPVVPGTVTGAPYRHGGPEFNKVTVTKAGDVTPLGETDQFMVSGRLVGPMVADPSSVRFPDRTMLTVSPAQQVTFTNQGSVDDVVIAYPAVTVDGVDADQFTVTGGTCITTSTTAVTLAPGQSCTANVQFNPTSPGEKAAALTLHHSGKNDPLEVQLSGLALALPNTAAITPSLRSVQFVDRHVGVPGEVVRLLLSNAGGDAPLAISLISGLDGTDFQIVGSTCTVNPADADHAVQVGATCELDLRYTPTAAGPAGATLHIESNAVTGDLDVPLSGRGSGAETAQAGTQNMGGFPAWIQDRNGVRMEACLVNDGHCVLLADATFNPGAAVSFPNNFPTESFYTLADSDIVNVPAHVCAPGVTAAGGTAQLRIATEAAFTSPAPTAGAQNMFNRIRVIANGLCANTSYTFTHPYGTISFTTDGNGEIRPKAGTFDQDGVLTTFPVTSFLRWDPNVAPAAPAGYVGSYATLHKLVGGTHSPDGLDVVNYFSVALPGGGEARTDLFNLAGRVAGPVVMNPTAQSFGTFEVGALAVPEEYAFSVSNIGVEDAHVTAIALGGADAGDFQLDLAGSSCNAATLVRDSDCVVLVRFLGSSTTGTKAATLTVTTDASRPTVTAALSATVIPTQTPSLTVSPTSLALGSLQVGAPSTIQTITVKNSGTGWLTLNANTGFTVTNASIQVLDPLPGGNPRCAAAVELGPLGLCDIRFTVTPTAKGAVTASYRAEGQDTTLAHVENHVPIPGVLSKTVGITATGVQATITASATSVSISARAGETKNVKVSLTNTGTANFSLAGAPAIEVVDQVLGSGATAKFTPIPTHNCNNILPGKSCQVTINFTPGAGSTVAPGNTYRVYVYLYGNASNLGSKASGTGLRLSVTGTRAR